MRKANLVVALLMILTAVGLGSLPYDTIARELSYAASGVAEAGSSSAGTYVERQIPIEITARVTKDVIRRGDSIPLEVTIHNGFTGPVDFKTFNLEPNEWNGETPSLSLYDIYRGKRAEGLFQGRPVVEPPIAIPAMPLHRIEPGASLTLETDVRKWSIADGWLPGKYRMALRVNNLQVDGHAALSIEGEPIEFEIRN